MILRIIFLSLSFILFNTAQGAHLKPWFDHELVPLLEGSYTLQKYDKVKVKNHSTPYQSLDHFLNLGVFGAFAPYSVELETAFAGTTCHNFNWEDVRLTGRYQLSNDISGESPVSAVLGATISRTDRKFVEDISTFHHGRWEYLFHGSVGKEFACGPTWNSRFWGLAGFGVADEGSIWFFSHLEAEGNACGKYWYGIFLNGLMGLGDKPLSPCDFLACDFLGYGPIQHRSLDLGAHLNISLWEYGTLEAKYSYRVFAYNFPGNAHLLTLRYEYPFGL